MSLLFSLIESLLSSQIQLENVNCQTCRHIPKKRKHHLICGCVFLYHFCLGLFPFCYYFSQMLYIHIFTTFPFPNTYLRKYCRKTLKTWKHTLQRNHFLVNGLKFQKSLKNEFNKYMDGIFTRFKFETCPSI